MSNNMQNIKEKKENEKLKIHTLREETKNGPKKVKVPVQKARVEGCHAEQKMTTSQPHGETTNVTEQTSSRSTSSQKSRSSKQQQGRHPVRHAEWEMQQNSKFYNSQDEEQGL